MINIPDVPATALCDRLSLFQQTIGAERPILGLLKLYIGSPARAARTGLVRKVGYAR